MATINGRRTWTTSTRQERKACGSCGPQTRVAGGGLRRTPADARPRTGLDDTSRKRSRTGQHVPESKAPTVRAACHRLDRARRGRRAWKARRMRQRQYHVDRHIVPLLGADTKLVARRPRIVPQWQLAALVLEADGEEDHHLVQGDPETKAKLAHLAANIDPIEEEGAGAAAEEDGSRYTSTSRSCTEVKAVIEATADDPKAPRAGCLVGVPPIEHREFRRG